MNLGPIEAIPLPNRSGVADVCFRGKLIVIFRDMQVDATFFHKVKRCSEAELRRIGLPLLCTQARSTLRPLVDRPGVRLHVLGWVHTRITGGCGNLSSSGSQR